MLFMCIIYHLQRGPPGCIGYIIIIISVTTQTQIACQIIGGPKMSGNFVRERQRIVYIYNIHKVGNLISPDEHMTCVKHKIHRSWN